MVNILDHRGQPIARALSAEPQTARLAWLHQQFGTHPSRGLTPAKLAGILEQAEQGDLIAQCDLFEDMEEKDGHVFAEMSKRKRALLGLDWDIVAPRNASAAEEQAAGLVKELIEDLSCIEDVILDMGDAIGQAYSCQEIEWHREGKEWMPKAITHRPPNWFTVTQADRNNLVLRTEAADPSTGLWTGGEALRPWGWIKHIHRAKSGYLARTGLHRILAWPFLFKNYSVRDLAEFLEIYGLPMRLGHYPPGASDSEKATLLRAVTSIGHNAAGIIPEGMAIEFAKAAEGTNDPFEAMINWCERTQSKAILGATLTSQTDGGSGAYALGQVHNEVRQDLRDSDAIQVAATLTRDLVYPLAVLNTGAVDSLRRCPRWVFDCQEPEDLKLYADSIPKLVGVGMRIPSAYVHEKLKIPEPEEGEDVLQMRDSALRPAQDGTRDSEKEQARIAAPSAALRTGLRAQAELDEFDVLSDDPLDQLGAGMAGDWERVTSPILNTVFELAEKSQSFEEFQAGLAQALPQMDITELGELLAQGQFAARVWGRVNNS